MKKIILSFFFFLIFITNFYGQDVTGQWNGLLKFPGGQLTLVINITATENGYSATMDSPDQDVTDMPVKTITFKDNKLDFFIPEARIHYTGILENNIITGTFKQGNSPMPLNLSREKIKRSRPQEPKQPYPYHSEDITFKNEKAGITLAGTLTLPKKEGSFPAVILISGSGAQNRDSEILGHKPFLVLADHLTKNGIAVLRFDDRGTAKSEGNFGKSTSEDFATDLEAGIDYLKQRKEVNKKRIGIIGHSEGGMIAPMVASKNNDVNFIVLLAGTGIPGDEILLLQTYLVGKTSGMPETELEKLKDINKSLYNVVKTETDNTAIKEKLKTVGANKLKPHFLSKNIPENQIDQIIEMQIADLSSPWTQFFIRYNPAAALEKTKCPVLAINGSNDLQVPAKENLTAIKKALDKAKNKNVTIVELQGLNHLFQQSTTGAPSEYGQIEETFSPVALNEISEWIKKQIK